jgi:fructosamine-3-kinase
MTKLWDQIVDQIAAAQDSPFRIDARSALGGGCINETYRIEGGGRCYFVKLNRSDRLEMFTAEQEGLNEIRASDTLRAPRPICLGHHGDRSYLVLEYLELGGRLSAARFGEGLAAMHRCTRDRFGWHRDNTIGSTAQINTPSADWIGFWRSRRLGFQLDLAERHGASSGLIDRGRDLSERLHEFFEGYDPQPSLLHGDLWGGNYDSDADGHPVIYDPAVYFGDRETDLAMTELFGGPGAEFYAAYDSAWPIDPGYSVRRELYNLYHILNHYNLFGGGYSGQAQRMVARLLAQLG